MSNHQRVTGEEVEPCDQRRRHRHSDVVQLTNISPQIQHHNSTGNSVHADETPHGNCDDDFRINPYSRLTLPSTPPTHTLHSSSSVTKAFFFTQRLEHEFAHHVSALPRSCHMSLLSEVAKTQKDSRFAAVKYATPVSLPDLVLCCADDLQRRALVGPCMVFDPHQHSSRRSCCSFLPSRGIFYTVAYGPTSLVAWILQAPTLIHCQPRRPDYKGR